jgi:hypothetical protein
MSPFSFRTRVLAPLAASIVALGLASCGSSTSVPATEVIVHVRVDSTLYTTAATTGSLRIDVESSADGISFDGFVHSGIPRALPDPSSEVRVALTPRGGDATRMYRVTATVLVTGGVSLVVARLIGGYREGATLDYQLLLAASCSGAECSDVQTCQSGGDCVDARMPSSAAYEVRDAGPIP